MDQPLVVNHQPDMAGKEHQIATPQSGTAIAFGVGYVIGTRSGRERYLQITRVARQLGSSAPVTGTATLVTEKSRAVAALGVERMKDTIGVRLGWRDGDQAADAIALDLAEDLATALNSRWRLPERWPSPERAVHAEV